MKKEKIKRLRDKMVYDMWQQKKSDWAMQDLAVFFNLSLPHIYRIIRRETANQRSVKKIRS